MIQRFYLLGVLILFNKYSAINTLGGPENGNV